MICLAECRCLTLGQDTRAVMTITITIINNDNKKINDDNNNNHDNSNTHVVNALNMFTYLLD